MSDRIDERSELFRSRATRPCRAYGSGSEMPEFERIREGHRGLRRRC